MGRLLLILLAVISLSSAGFERPWENRSWIVTNPHIWTYGTDIWWNLPELHKAIDSLDAESMGQIPANGTALLELKKTKENALAAENLKTACIQSLEASARISFFSPVLAFFNVFTKISECLQYDSKWKSTIDSSLSALDASFAEADRTIAAAEKQHSFLVFSGICKGSYYGPGSEHCPELNSAFASVENNISEGDYGKYASAHALAASLKDELIKPVPDLSSVKAILEIIWSEGGVVTSFSDLQDKSIEAKKLAESEFQAKYEEAISKKAQAERQLAELKKQKFSLIRRTAMGYGLEVGSVEKKFSELQKTSLLLAAMAGEAKLEFSRSTRHSYLANAILNASSAVESYDLLSQDLLELEEEAREAVSDQKIEAEQEISKAEGYLSKETPSPAAVSYLESAKKFLEMGEISEALGDKFTFYYKASVSARTARSLDLNAQVGAEVGLSELRSLISRAEKDQINVVTEKESLALLSKLPPELSKQKVGELASSIQSKARIKYEDLILGKRNSILDKIRLAGSDAIDLASEMDRFEKSLIEDGTILLPAAIGSLAKLNSDYDSIDKSLDEYMNDVVGNAMSASAITIIPEARLDSPSEVIVDLALTNSRQYSSKDAEAKISLDRPLQLMLTDIDSGKNGVESVRMGENGKLLLITFSEVAPYETRRLTFRKNVTIGRTLSDSIVAEGTGDGSASVVRKIHFELDTDIKRLFLSPEIKNPIIDGTESEEPLSQGRHTLTSEYLLEDAYSETMHNLRAYSLGTNSQVEFEIKIEPKIPLAKVPLFINSLNSSHIISMDLVSVSGEQVKNERRLSQTQYGADIINLKKGRVATIRVTYLVENTKDFVVGQLELLRAQNLSENAKSMLQLAEKEFNSGNYSESLELVEKTKLLLSNEEKTAQKSQKEFSELSSAIGEELSEITSALVHTSLNGSIIQKLSSRAAELQTTLGAANGSDISPLEKIDTSWLSKELTSLKKDIYKQYNDLKERFFQAGNSSTPSTFLDFEQRLSEFESGNRLNAAMAALEALEDVKKTVGSAESLAAREKDSRRSLFEKSKSGLLDSWDRYSRQASAAKGTEYSSLFTESERKTNALIKEAEDSLDKDPRLFEEKIGEMEQAQQRFEDTLVSLSQQSLGRISLLEAELADGTHPVLSEKLATAKAMAENGDYVNSLRAASSISKDIDAPKEADDGLLIIGVSAFALLIGAGFYLMKKPKKELRKLNDWNFAPKASENEAKKPAFEIPKD